MDEIEEFLRQAAARRNRAQQPAQQPPPQQRPPQQQQRPPQRPQQGIQFVPPQAPRPVQQQPPPVRQLQPSIGNRQIDTSTFDQRSSQMGMRERQADERSDDRLHEKFDHTISDLAGASAPMASAYEDKDDVTYSDEKKVAKATAVSNIMSMLRSPANIQQAIILNEILQRPEHRW